MGGNQVIIRKAWLWTIVGNMLGGGHDPYKLKTSFFFGRFRKKSRGICHHYKRLNCFVPTQFSILFQWKSKVVDVVDPSLINQPFYWHLMLHLKFLEISVSLSLVGIKLNSYCMHKFNKSIFQSNKLKLNWKTNSRLISKRNSSIIFVHMVHVQWNCTMKIWLSFCI
jgi:hypothetical protein